MTKYSNLLLSLLLFTVLIVIFGCLGLSGNDGKNIYAKNGNMTPGINPVSTYKEECGQCHLPYPPEFMPSGSWEKLLGSTEKHFGESLNIDPKNKDLIAAYLKEKGAERSDTKISEKIIQSLEGKIPLRLTEVPYILKKHRKVSDVLTRNSIGSLANCKACHRLADDWKFSKRIVIPD